MNAIPEIKAAIEKLSPSQIEELARWVEAVRVRRPKPAAMDNWLEQARSIAIHGATTEAIMRLTRDEA